MLFKLFHFVPKCIDTTDGKINIDKPLWDQSSYIGRWKHFSFITDCSTIFVSDKRLKEAKQFCDDYSLGKVPPDTRVEDIMRAKQLRDSAFHPDTGELINIIGRMSFQLPISVILTTTMLTFYKSAVAVVLCQIANQTHNAIVNYENRNAMAEDGNNNNAMKYAYLCAVLASSMVALGCKKLLRRKGPIAARWVPFCAVIAGHMVNLPIMRQKEITSGIPLFTEDADDPIMISRIAAIKGISECILTRIVMATPSLIMIPILTQKMKVYCFYQRRPWILYPTEALLCVFCCMFGVPSALAIFPQYNSMNPKLLELYPPEYEKFRSNDRGDVNKVYYNKGL